MLDRGHGPEGGSMLRSLALSCSLLAITAAGIAGDLVVDTGEFVIGPGDTYQNVTVSYPGSVSMTGGTITGDVLLIGTGGDRTSWTMTDGLVQGDFNLHGGNLTVLGGAVEGDISAQKTAGGDIPVRHARVDGRIDFDLTRANILIEHSTIGTININNGSWTVRDSHVTGGLYAGAYLNFNSFGGVTDSLVEGNVSATSPSGASVLRSTVLGGVGNSSVTESTVGGLGGGSAANSTILGGVGGADVTRCVIMGNYSSTGLHTREIEDSEVFGSVIISNEGGPMSGTIVHGTTTFNSCRFNENAIEGCDFRDRVMLEFCSSNTFTNCLFRDGISMGLDSYSWMRVYRLSVDGKPINLPQGDTRVVDGGDIDGIVDIEVIWPDGRRAAFPADLFRDDYLGNTVIRFVGTPLENDGCSPVDLAAPFGVLDLADIVAFVSLYLLEDPAADLAGAGGVIDLADVTAFVDGALAGCP